MTEQQILTPHKAISLELISFVRSMASLRVFPSAEVVESPSRILAATGIEFSSCNAAFELGDPSHILEKEIDETISFFSSKNLPFIWWTGAKNLEKKGFSFGGAMKGIALDLSEELPFAVPSVEVSVRQVETEDDLKSFCSISNACFPMGPKADAQFLPISEAAWQSGKQLHFIASINEKAVSLVSLSLGELACGIWYCGTLPEYRKKGIGSALTLFALQEAQRRGYPFAIGILFPQAIAWGSFQLLGFKEYCDLPFYVYTL